MPSAQDILDAINGADSRLDDVKAKLDTTNSNLNDIKGKLDAINASVNQMSNLMQWGFTPVITLLQYADQALFINDQQNDTMICILEHISKNTCALLNE